MNYVSFNIVAMCAVVIAVVIGVVFSLLVCITLALSFLSWGMRGKSHCLK